MAKKYFIFIALIIILIGIFLFVRVSFSPGERQDLIDEVEAIIPAVTSSHKVSSPTASAQSGFNSPVLNRKKIEQNVPFTSQAPLFQWSDGRFQDGCEEASAVMAMAWVHGTKLGSPETVTDEILKMIDFEGQSAAGYQPDLSAADTAKLIKDYWHYSGVTVRENVNAQDLIDELSRGKILVSPVNGRLLNNPNFTAPGPLYHMLVVLGYNPATSEFITNDPGTRRGSRYRYGVDTFMNALRDYPSGHHEAIVENIKRIIVVSKQPLFSETKR